MSQWFRAVDYADRTLRRYLTKVTDQVVALISEEHVNTLVWRDEAEDGVVEDSEDDSDRLFSFQVAKTNEQEENVVMRPGFKVSKL